MKPHLRPLVATIALWAAHLHAADPLSTWHTRSSPYGTTNHWRGIAFGNGRFVAVNQSGGYVITSTDGVQWTPRTVNTRESMFGLAFGQGTFVAVGEGGSIFTSPDGASWQPRDSGTSAHLYHVSHQNNLFLAVGGSGRILSSPDGATWTARNTGTTNQWRAACYGNGTYAVVGYRTQAASIYSRAAASSTLAGWMPQDTGYASYLSGVTFGAGRFVACGYAGAVQTSLDGIQWTAPFAVANRWLLFTTYDNGTFMAVGESATIASSTTGLSWTNRHSISSKVLHAIAYGNGTWIAVGNNGLILQSDPVAPAPLARPLLSNPARSASQFAFRFTGEIGQSYDVQFTTNFIHWTKVKSVTCNASPMPVNLTSQTGPRRFYRVVKP